MYGTRRFDTPDTSRNNALLALITLGEGWHNNHHRFSVSARQGFRWWELDITYYLLVLLSWLKIVRDLRPVPQKILEASHRKS
jgi:stearoyl-CoA desaturase (delta-9 desaturase)